jgi:hypothetical protein
MALIEKTVVVHGGSYRRIATDEVVTAVRWLKDGDHPLVSRYPIEGRIYKGLLEVSPKEKYALRFGDWVVEDGKGVYVVEAYRFASTYEEIKP